MDETARQRPRVFQIVNTIEHYCAGSLYRISSGSHVNTVATDSAAANGHRRVSSVWEDIMKGGYFEPAFPLADTTCPDHPPSGGASRPARPQSPASNLSTLNHRDRFPRVLNSIPSWARFAATMPLDDEVKIGSQPSWFQAHILLLVVMNSFHFLSSSNAAVPEPGSESILRGVETAVRGFLAFLPGFGVDSAFAGMRTVGNGTHADGLRASRQLVVDGAARLRCILCFGVAVTIVRVFWPGNAP